MHYSYLKNAALVAVTLIAMCACNQSDKTESKDNKTETSNPDSDKTNAPGLESLADETTGTLNFMRDVVGKYPAEVRLLENAVLTERLKKLLGDKYNFLIENWGVENPGELDHDMVVVTACQSRNCGTTNYIIIADVYKNVLFAGIREEGQVKKYSENGSMPVRLNTWAEGK